MRKKENKAYSTLTQNFDLLIDEPLKKYTSIKVGGPADLLALPKNKQELKGLFKKASDLHIPITLFGGGTNLLVTDNGIRGLVVITKQLKSKIRIIKTESDKEELFTAAGERLSKVCQIAINHSLSGLEFAAGIPGTIGGSIMMNAGTKSGNMSDIVQSIEVLDPKTLTFKTIDKKDLDFSYRSLNLTDIIVAATLTLNKKPLEKIEDAFKLNLSKKNATQPVSFASAGCFFKNPALGKSAGELIEKSGLKGTRVNDAMVSEKHANFIVNNSNATCEDILLLKQHIQKTVLKKYQIKLQTEVRVEGE